MSAIRNAMMKLRHEMMKCIDPNRMSVPGYAPYIEKWDKIIEETEAELAKELKPYRDGIEAVLGTVEREKKRADQALISMPYPTRSGPNGQAVDDHIRASAQSHQAGRILSNVRYAFKNAGLPVETVSGPAKLTDVKPPACTCSFDDSEEMTRHAPLCAVTVAGFNW